MTSTSVTKTSRRSRLGTSRLLLGLGAVAALGLAACGGGESGGGDSDLTGTILIDGSSTVAPLMTLAAEDFQNENSGVQVTVGTSGTARIRCPLETAIGFSLPVLMWGSSGSMLLNMTCTCPERSSVSAGPVPLYGT